MGAKAAEVVGTKSIGLVGVLWESDDIDSERSDCSGGSGVLYLGGTDLDFFGGVREEDTLEETSRNSGKWDSKSLRALRNVDLSVAHWYGQERVSGSSVLLRDRSGTADEVGGREKLAVSSSNLLLVAGFTSEPNL